MQWKYKIILQVIIFISDSVNSIIFKLGWHPKYCPFSGGLLKNLDTFLKFNISMSINIIFYYHYER